MNNPRPKVQGRRMSRNMPLIASMVAVLIVFPNQCNGDDLVHRLELLREQYQNAPTIHFRASSIMLQGAADGGRKQQSVKTLYEYWGKNTKYRINSSLRPEGKRADGLTTHIAYDGSRFQHFNVPDSRLIYREEDIDIMPRVSLNPMLYPVIFFSPGLDRPCARLKFKDLYDDKVWERMLGSAKVVSDSSPDRELVFELPGGYEGDIRCVFHVHLGTDPDFMPVKIVRLSDNGSELARFAIQEYQVIEFDGKKTYWPKSVRCELLDDGKVTVDEKTTIETLEVGKELPTGIFTIDFTLADVVWDEDHKVALKTPSGHMPIPEGLTSPSVDTQYAADIGVEDEVKKTKPDATLLVVAEHEKQHTIWLILLCTALAATIAYTLLRKWIKNSKK